MRELPAWIFEDMTTPQWPKGPPAPFPGRGTSISSAAVDGRSVTAPSSRCSTRCGHTGGAWGMAGQRLRLQPCTRYMPNGVQANYQERNAFTSSSSLCERSLLPTGRPVDEGRSGANRRCRGRRSPPWVRLRRGKLRQGAQATGFRSIASPSAERFGALRCFLRSCCM
jgi:hypothetical protein